jgi:hypothetical protein
MNTRNTTSRDRACSTLVTVAAILPVLLVGTAAASAGLSVSTAAGKRTLTVSVTGKGRLVSSPRGLDCSRTCSARFRNGTRVRLTPIAADGWELAGWSGACKGSRSCSVKLAGAKVVLVAFRRIPPPAPPPAPPPSPAAKAGHFTGRTADNELWAFDIAPDGLSLNNLRMGQLNESCNPPDFYLSGGQQTLPGAFPVARDGSFSINLSTSTSVDGDAGTDTFVITGQISGGVATGTYRDDTTFSSGGTAYGCTTGNQTWSAAWTS